MDGVDDDAAVVWVLDCKSESIGDVGFEVDVNGDFVEMTDGLALPVFGYAKCNGIDCGLSGIFTNFLILFSLYSIYSFVKIHLHFAPLSGSVNEMFFFYQKMVLKN